jgi:gluconate:H+ symporter, GntP family
MNPLWIALIGVAVVVGGILALRLHAFLSLMAGAAVVALLTPAAVVYRFSLHSGLAEKAAQLAAQKTIGEHIADGFGATARDIGILIAMAAILGKTLMESGAAEKLVLSLRRAVGEGRVALAFLISGFVLAALVLSDTTFYLLIPLARVARARSGKNYTLYILSIVAGAVMTHSLVPPAAGPAEVALALHVKLSVMILGGVIVGAFASSSGFLYAHWANRRWDIPLRNAVGVSAAELERISNRDETTLPPLWLAVTPIALPVILIAMGDVSTNRILTTLGDKNVALMIAAAIGLLMVWRRKDNETAARFSASIGHALGSAGVMVLIISAGGAFGYVVRQTDIAIELRDKMPSARLALLPLAFLITAAVRTAQGSAIVSMVTAIGVVGPIAAAGALGFHPVYLALAIGCGSKPIPWMNDAGFWIIGQMSGMTEAETLKTVSIMMVIMGVVGLAATMAGAWLFPFA